MATNVAAENLAALEADIQQAEQTASQTASALQDATQSFMATGDVPAAEEAAFKLSESLPTAVAASFILGPIGGAVMGLAQGWLGKEARQNELDDQARENELFKEGQAAIRANMDRHIASTEDPDDLEQLYSLRSQQEAGFKYMQSGETETAAMGRRMLAESQAGLERWAATNEAQNIARQQRIEDVAFRTDNETARRYEALMDDFRADLTIRGLGDVVKNSNSLLLAAERGTPFDLIAAAKLMEKTLDDRSAALGSETSAYGEQGGYQDRFAVWLEKAGTGRTMTADQRRELSQLARDVRDETLAIARTKEQQYLDQAVNLDIPEDKWNTFRVADTYELYQQGPIPDDDVITQAGNAAKTAIEKGVQQATQDYYTPSSETPSIEEQRAARVREMQRIADEAADRRRQRAQGYN